MNEAKAKFVSVEEIIEYIINNPNKIIGFTQDEKDDVEVKGEPTGWYGIQFSEAFDGESIIIGYFGEGVLWSENDVYDVEDGVTAFIEFWKSEFNDSVNEKTLICTDPEDWK